MPKSRRAETGQPELAVKLFGAADAHWSSAAVMFPLFHRFMRERWQRLAVDAIGEPAADAAFSAGRALSLDQAIADARQGAVRLVNVG